MACAERATFIEKRFEIEFSQGKLDLLLYHINKYLHGFVEKTLQMLDLFNVMWYFNDKYKYKKHEIFNQKESININYINSAKIGYIHKAHTTAVLI